MRRKFSRTVKTGRIVGVACLEFRGEKLRGWRMKFVKVFSLESLPLYGILAFFFLVQELKSKPPSSWISFLPIPLPFLLVQLRSFPYFSPFLHCYFSLLLLWLSLYLLLLLLFFLFLLFSLLKNGDTLRTSKNSCSRYSWC